MPNQGFTWSRELTRELLASYNAHKGKKQDFCKSFAKKYGLSDAAVWGKLNRSGSDAQSLVAKSPYPIYDDPLVMEGDAVILPDIEFPYHNAEFLNKVLDLSKALGIKQCILAGDVLHFDGLSGWQPNWTAPNDGGITQDAESKLMEFAKTLSPKKQGEFMSLIGDIGERNEKDGLSTELNIARKELKKIVEMFDKVDCVIGNHEGRLLRALEVAVSPDELLRLMDLDDPKIRIAPYYFSYLNTEEGQYKIEHPKNFGKFSAHRLASKNLCHILMAHSHQLCFTFDVSGQYYAIEMGCICDERRFPYAAQRDNTSPTHGLGSVIVLDGYPYLLHEGTDWERMKKL